MKTYFTTIFYILLIQISFAQFRTIKFEHISLEQGLSQSSIYSIIQDNRGFLWFGTGEGLNRYDGNHFAVYKMNILDSNSISENWITSIVQDKESYIWIGTDGGGLNKYDQKTEQFTSYLFSKKNPFSISGNSVRCIFEDSKGFLWVGTDKGLNKFDKTKGTFTRFFHDKLNSGSISNDVINCIFESTNGELWIGTNEGGLCKFDAASNSFTHFTNKPSDLKSLAGNSVWSIREEKNTPYLWIATFSGLEKFNRNTGECIHFKNNPLNPSSICSNEIQTLLIDKESNLWIGTAGGGLSILYAQNKEKGIFNNYLHNPNDLTTLSQNQISSIIQDNSGVIWIGTKGGGINKYQRDYFNHYKKMTSNDYAFHNSIWSILEDNNGALWLGYENELYCFDKGFHFTEKYKTFSNHASNANENSYVRFSALAEDKYGRIWVGTIGGGLSIFDKALGKKQTFLNNKKDNNSLVNNNIRVIYADSKGIIWIGTANGLSRLEYIPTKEPKFTNFKNDTSNLSSLSNSRINSIFEDHEGTIWIGTSGGGLNRIMVDKNDPENPAKYSFKQYKTNKSDINSISDVFIMSFCEDSDGNLWIGTYNGGLNLMNRKSETFKSYRVEDGLPNNVIYGILPDKQGYLWLSTNSGLSRFSPKTKKFKNFDQKDGLQSNEFNRGAHFKSKNGTLYFAGINGLNSFLPENIKDNPIKPQVVITNFKLFNKVITPGLHSPLSVSVIETNEITLTHEQYIFTFDFAALSYISQHKNLYAYKMEGLDNEWIYTDGKNKSATYTDLRGGTYTFHVKASNNDGLWNETGRSIVITILPPFWETWWFRLLLGFFILGAITIAYIFRINRIKKQKLVLEKLVKERTAEVEQQKEELKVQAEQLQLSNNELEKLSIVASETNNAVSIFDEKGNLEWFNFGYTRMFGFTFEEFKKIDSANIFDKHPALKEKLELSISNNEIISYQIYTPTKNGQKIWIQTTLTPITEAMGTIRKIIAIDSDITSLKQAESEILQQNEEISAQKNALEEQNEKIHAYNEKISGSIRYAKTIQQAILPEIEHLRNFFECFLIFRPKDIVSGDFHWFSALNSKFENIDIFNLKDESTGKNINISDLKYIFLAAVDCTGHGIPGAFMSLIGYTLLNEIISIKKIYEPDQILNQLNLDIRAALRQENTENRDGMDICFCRLENMTSESADILYCGAKRPLFIVRNNSEVVEILPATRKSIGGIYAFKNIVDFANYRTTLYKNDTIFLTSDGVIDQNNLERKRFGTARFLNTISQNKYETMQEQKKLLEMALNQFQQNDEQRDDITVLAIKI